MTRTRPVAAGGRARRAVTLLLATLIVSSLPALPGTTAPASARTGTLVVTDWTRGADGYTSAEVPAGDIVTIAIATRDARAWRARRDGTWSPWRTVTAPDEHAPDPSSDEARGARSDRSDPIWTGRIEALQFRSTTATPLAVDTVAVADLSWRPGARHPAAAEAASLWPQMVPRSAWDPAGECQAVDPPEYTSGSDRVYVHHTFVFPEYAPDEADDAIRAMCLSHLDSRGFNDLGYNFLIDAYGVIYQGRAGGILRSVVGAHASGFNQRSIGVAVIGNFEVNEVPAAAMASLDELLTWLADWHGIDPRLVTPHVSSGGATTPYVAGDVVDLPTIVGHRATASSSPCPGAFLFAELPGVRERVASRLGLAAVAADVGADATAPPASRAPLPASDPPSQGEMLETLVDGVTVARRILRGEGVPIRPPLRP